MIIFVHVVAGWILVGSLTLCFAGWGSAAPTTTRHLTIIILWPLFWALLVAEFWRDCREDSK